MGFSASLCANMNSCLVVLYGKNRDVNKAEDGFPTLSCGFLLLVVLFINISFDLLHTKS